MAGSGVAARGAFRGAIQIGVSGHGGVSDPGFLVAVLSVDSRNFKFRLIRSVVPAAGAGPEGIRAEAGEGEGACVPLADPRRRYHPARAEVGGRLYPYDDRVAFV